MKMLRVTGLSLGFLLAGLLALSPQAGAATAVATSEATSSNSVWDAIKKNGKASYMLWLTGMHTEALSGNRTGGGTDLTADHYLAIGSSLGKGFTLKLTNLGRQSINEAPDTAGKTFVWQDPYVTLSKSGIYKNEAMAFNLDGYVRYYIPVSRPTIDNKNKGAMSDTGRGMVRFLLNPSKSFFDGKLTFSVPSLTNIRFNSLTPQERFDRATIEKAKTGKGNKDSEVVSYRNDMYFYTEPTIAYTVSNKLEAYLSWWALWNHSTNGQWTSVSDSGSDQALAPGVNWTPTKKVLVTAYLSYALSAAKAERQIDKAGVGLIMSYTFL